MVKAANSRQVPFRPKCAVLRPDGAGYVIDVKHQQGGERGARAEAGGGLYGLLMGALPTSAR
jgi:hypothetical protein